ncbi:Protein of unknown function [Limimonas halophila]|uniref:Uncharacterized protein n=1 Tax=Limimonas halophila TaxID=1082479 RepID=A0A1G7Q1F4_9PROT|nr:DUF3726 domain-containing protein [Limimonas halophila]SDF92288.1 Protein of unknown function [Limimonas halophila]
MLLSINELRGRYARAFEGMGFPAGLAPDAARIAATLDILGDDGLSRVLDRLDRLDGVKLPVPDLAVDGSSARLDGHGGSLLAVGADVLDVLDVLTQQHGEARIEVHGCRDVDFVTGLGGLAAARGIEGALLASLEDRERLVRVAQRRAEVQEGPPGTFAGVPADGLLVLGGQFVDTLDASACTTTLGFGAFDERHDDALENGVRVDDADWKRIYALGGRLLVPEMGDAAANAGVGGGTPF